VLLRHRGLEAQYTAGAGAAQLQAARALQVQARGDAVGALGFDQLVDETADLARVAAGFRRAFLAVVELLDHLHRQVDVVLLELEPRGGVVHQHVGVGHVDPRAVVAQVRVGPSGMWGWALQWRGQPRAAAARGAGRPGTAAGAGITARWRPGGRRARPRRG